MAEENQDWFAANAPQQQEPDWFAQNAPKLVEPQQGGVVSGIVAGLGRALNPINLVKGALDIGNPSDISKIYHYGKTLGEIVTGTPPSEAIGQNIPELQQQREAVFGQQGTREQAAALTGVGLQLGMVALPFLHGRLKVAAPEVAHETPMAEVAGIAKPPITEPIPPVQTEAVTPPLGKVEPVAPQDVLGKQESVTPNLSLRTGEGIRTSIKTDVGDLPITDPTDNVTDTLQGHTNTPAGARIEYLPINDVTGSITRKPQVEKLTSEMSGEGGHISRLIVDSKNNVVEGQHRLEALRNLGATEVPVVKIFGAEDFIPDVGKVKQAIKDSGVTHSDQVNQMMSHLGEALLDENGNVAELRNYDAPQGFEKPWNAAITEIERQKPSPASEAPVSTTATPLTQTEEVSGNKTPVAQTTAAGIGEAVLPHERPDFERGSIHINVRGNELDPSRPLSGWVLPAELGDNPNTMSTRYGRAGLTAVYVPKEFVKTSKTRPARIKEGYTPPPENVAVIPPEAVRPSGTIDWTKVFKREVPSVQEGGVSTTGSGIQKEVSTPTGGIENAIQEQSPSSVLPHPQEGTGATGSERVGVGQGIQGTETARARQGGTPENATAAAQEQVAPQTPSVTPETPAGTPTTGGVSAAALEKRPIAVPPPGETIGWQENTVNGHAWLDQGGDPQSIINKFAETKAVTTEDMGRMRAALERLQQNTNVSRDALRKDPTNPELIRAANESTTTEQNFTDAYKPMHTFAGANLASLKGQPPFTDDMATSYTALERRFQENMGRGFEPEESAKAEKITEKATKDQQAYKDQTSDLYKKTDETYKAVKGPNHVPTIQELAKALTGALEEVC